MKIYNEEELRELSERLSKETDEWCKNIEVKYRRERYKIYKSLFPDLTDEEIYRKMDK